jgi:Protein of unknown function (DUF664)
MASLSGEISDLFRRDLIRLSQQVKAFSQESLWRTLPGVSNSAGNLMLHLEGNLREFVGRQLGAVAYERKRPLEFSVSGVPIEEMLARTEDLAVLIPRVIARLSDAQMEAKYPEDALGVPLSTRQFLIHLQGHLNYHLGQIDYLRRILTEGKAVDYASLEVRTAPGPERALLPS